MQQVPILVGRSFTEQPDLVLVKDSEKLVFINKLAKNLIDESKVAKVVLSVAKDSLVPSFNLGHLSVSTTGHEGDLLIDASLHLQEGREIVCHEQQLQSKKTS